MPGADASLIRAKKAMNSSVRASQGCAPSCSIADDHRIPLGHRDVFLAD